MICRKAGMWEYTQISYQLREEKKEEERVSIMISDSRNTDNIPRYFLYSMSSEDLNE